MNAPMPHTQVEMGGNPTIGARIFALVLTVGVYIVLVGLIFLSPFALNSTAIQNDVYMTNLFLSPPIIILGAICLIIGWIGLQRAVNAGRASGIGMRPMIIATLGAVVMAAGYLAFGGQFMFASGDVEWPPYMNDMSIVVALVVGALVLVAALFWGLTRGEQRNLS